MSLLKFAITTVTLVLIGLFCYYVATWFVNGFLLVLYIIIGGA